MTTNTPLTDTVLEALLARYAGRVSAEGLQAGIMADVATSMHGSFSTARSDLGGLALSFEFPRA